MKTPNLTESVLVDHPDHFFEVIRWYPPERADRMNGGIVVIQRLATMTSVLHGVVPLAGQYMSRVSTHKLHGTGVDAYVSLPNGRGARPWNRAATIRDRTG
jgi:hypothetical protein